MGSLRCHRPPADAAFPLPGKAGRELGGKTTPVQPHLPSRSGASDVLFDLGYGTPRYGTERHAIGAGAVDRSRSLHSHGPASFARPVRAAVEDLAAARPGVAAEHADQKSTLLNSSHLGIS